MSHDLVMLPYLWLDHSTRQVPDTLEVALAIAHSERGRKKDRLRGLFFRRQPERITYLVKLAWPFYLLPHRGRNRGLLVDALEVFDSTFPYTTLDVTPLGYRLKGMQRHITSPFEYYDQLQRQKEKLTPAHRQRRFPGLVGHRELYSLVTQGMRRGGAMSPQIPTFLPSRKSAMSRFREYSRTLQDMHTTATEEIEQYTTVIAALRDTGYFFGDMAQAQQREVDESSTRQIESLRPSTERAMHHLTREKQSQLAAARRDVEAQIDALEHELAALETQRSRYRGSIEMRKREILREINRIRRDSAWDLQSLEDRYELRISSERRRVSSLESEKFRDLRELRWVEQKIYETSVTLQDTIRGTRETQETLITSLQQHSLQLPRQPPRPGQQIHLPCYIIGYQQKREHRIHLLPPLKLNRENWLQADPLLSTFDEAYHARFIEALGSSSPSGLAPTLRPHNILAAPKLLDVIEQELATLYRAQQVDQSAYFSTLSLLPRYFTEYGG